MVTRGRPKSDKKRQQILDAAAQLFASQGYTNTSLETVAAAAGVSKQTIYSHFSSKQEVLREGVKHQHVLQIPKSCGVEYSDENYPRRRNTFGQMNISSRSVKMIVVWTDASEKPALGGEIRGIGKGPIER